MKNVVTRIYSATDYISIAELKTHLRILSSDDDAYLANLLNGVFDHYSGLFGYDIRKSTADYFFTSPSLSQFHIPSRVLSLSSVKYRDSSGTLQTISASDYDSVLTISANYGYDVTLINDPSSLYEYGWRYKVTVVEGFAKPGDSVDVSKIFPDDLRHALYLYAEHLYTQRGSVVVGASADVLPFNHEDLIFKYAIKEFV